MSKSCLQMITGPRRWREVRSGACATARGFTLIELVIVVAIVAILAMIALPSYQRHMQKARRARAEGDLLQLAQMLERQYTVNRTYVGFVLPFTQSPTDGGATVAYTITLPNLTQGAYTLTATPTGPQTADPCAVLTVDQTGAKGASGTHPSGSCW
ncbi:type IV pilin protein [Dokdonella soli]